MRSDEKKTSLRFYRQLKLIEKTDLTDKIFYGFEDRNGNYYCHWQLKPDYVKGKKAKALAALYIAKARNIGSVYGCTCVCRDMSDGYSEQNSRQIYANADEIDCYIGKQFV